MKKTTNDFLLAGEIIDGSLVTHKEIKWYSGMSLKDCIEQLLEYKDKGELVYGNFNGKKLYSDSVTVDSAYMLIQNRTKAEADEAERKASKEYQSREAKHAANIPYLTQGWIEKGEKVLDQDKLDAWAEIVPNRLADLYKGMELGQTLELVEILKSGSFEAAYQVMSEQGHSGMSWGLIKSMVYKFSDKGRDFVKYVEEQEW